VNAGERERRVRVAQVVVADARRLGVLHLPPEHVRERVRVDDRPVLPREDEIRIRVGVAHQLAFEHLPRSVLTKGLDRRLVERD
jgi:hypothetical protein